MPSPEHEAMVAGLDRQAHAEPTSIEAMRAAMAEMVGYFEGLEFPADVKQEPVRAGGVPGAWFTPPDPRPAAAVLYLHGGGYVMGSIATHRSLIARLARAAGLRVLALDYRLAPEHPFPAAIEDATVAYHWLRGGGIPASGIAFAGDSAGGGLVLGTLVSLRDAGDPLPAAAVCLSPLADLELTGASARGGIDDPMVSRAGTQKMAEAYLQGQDPRDPRASSIHADFKGFPPLHIEVGTREILLDDAKRVAERARRALVDVTLELGEGLTHVWQLHPHLPESGASIARIATFLRARLG